MSERIFSYLAYSQLCKYYMLHLRGQCFLVREFYIIHDLVHEYLSWDIGNLENAFFKVSSKFPIKIHKLPSTLEGQVTIDFFNYNWKLKSIIIQQSIIIVKRSETSLETEENEQSTGLSWEIC